MSIKLKYHSIGHNKFKAINIEAKVRDELPLRYLEGESVCGVGNELWYFDGDGDCEKLFVGGEIYTREEIETNCITIRRCVERLKEIKGVLEIKI